MYNIWQNVCFSLFIFITTEAPEVHKVSAQIRGPLNIALSKEGPWRQKDW